MIIISLNSFCIEKCCRQNDRENQNTHFTFSHLYPNMVLFMWLCKIFCKLRQATDGNVALCLHYVCWVTKSSIQTYTHNIYYLVVFCGQNKFTCSINCKYRTAETLCTLEIHFVSGT
jgi:hypothetical protein